MKESKREYNLNVIAFLEQQIFRSKAEAWEEINIGASSFTYRVKTSGRIVFVKILKNSNRRDVQRICRIFKALEKNPKINTPKLLSLGGKNFFEYGGRYGLVVSFVEGSYIHSRKMDKEHMAKILNTYGNFLKTDFSRVSFPKSKENRETEIRLKLSAAKKKFVRNLKNQNPVSRMLFCRLSKPLNEMAENILKKEIGGKKKALKRIIHGDFQNRNILFEKGKAVLLDFDEIRYGHPYEDILRFILCLMRRLPVYRRKIDVFETWVNLVNEKKLLDKKAWERGIDLFYMIYMLKIYTMKNGFRKIKKLIFFPLSRKFYGEIIRTVKANG